MSFGAIGGGGGSGGGGGGLVADAINDGTTTVAPSQNAVFDALASKANSANPTLTGTVTVPDASFSLAKLANISTARILGRRTAGTGPPEEITIAQMKTDLGVPTSFFNGLIRPYQTGYFYGPERQAAGTSSFATGFIRLTPYIPPATGTFDRIGLVTTATTSGKARFGIYDSDHATIPGAPKTLITGSDSAEIDTSAATADRLSTISVTLTGGHLYWLASAFNATTAAHHITRTAMAASDNWGIQGNLSNANGPEAYYMSNAYGAMPSTVSSLVTIVMTTAMPAVFLRAA